MSSSLPSDSDKALELLAHPAVLKHLDILQSIVSRLAQHSSICKNWCVTLVAGVLVLAFSKDVRVEVRSSAPLIACILIMIFWAVDAYYHSLERQFRRQSTALVSSIHQGTFSPAVVLIISDKRTRRERLEDTLAVGLTSAATGGFYAALLIAVFLIRSLIS